MRVALPEGFNKSTANTIQETLSVSDGDEAVTKQIE